ncbi:class I adenylate-forming enzyme family protein [uncultured Williamsia sp.]|uniref:class I adenylate-forming enzyme family protein n=1 Tax=uncultured Williamsia sp. TaxID=259311 RepID=UPI0026179366|nr:class I adenylate-forming enzyme family protein [uncultured Williamsia sp.]
MPFPDYVPTIPVMLDRVVRQHGDTTAIVCGGESATYADLAGRSARLARTLLAHGVGKGDHVGILMPNSVDWAVAYLAVTRIGAVAVPLNTFYRASELGWTARHADLSAILAWPRSAKVDFTATLEAAFDGLSTQVRPGRLRIPSAPYLRTVFVWGESDRRWATAVVGDSTETGRGPDGVDDDLLAAVESAVVPSDDALIIYTSGSTGDPKGPRHTQGTVVRHTFNLTSVYLVTSDDVLFTSMPFFWVGGLITGLHAVMHHGATLVTQEAFDADAAVDLMQDHRATIALGWPQQGKTLAQSATARGSDLSSLRRTSMPALAPDIAPPATGALNLGMTETCGMHIGADPYVAQPESRRGTFGQSLDGMTHRIVDPETGVDVGPGVEGEIWVRGVALMQGLYKFEREETFTPDGYLRTGDAGFADADGWITYTGRLGDMIKTGSGVNVTPTEVEAALMGCAGVQEAYVAGVDDPDAGTIVGAALIAAPGADLDVDAIRTELKSTLSAYKIPKRVTVVEKAALPFTSTGKIKRRDLAVMLADLAPVGHNTTTEHARADH